MEYRHRGILKRKVAESYWSLRYISTFGRVHYAAIPDLCEWHPSS